MGKGCPDTITKVGLCILRLDSRENKFINWTALGTKQNGLSFLVSNNDVIFTSSITLTVTSQRGKKENIFCYRPTERRAHPENQEIMLRFE